jgi:hypothetical protein
MTGISNKLSIINYLVDNLDADASVIKRIIYFLARRLASAALYAMIWGFIIHVFTAGITIWAAIFTIVMYFYGDANVEVRVILFPFLPFVIGGILGLFVPLPD